jgi:hypothetical protein
MLIVFRCASLAAALGGYDYGNFFEYASVGYDRDINRVVFTDYPTGESPWYSDIRAWCVAFGCLGFSVTSFEVYRSLQKRRHAS